MAETLPYIVELWDKKTENVDEVKARLGSSIMAQAAYDAAVQEYGSRYLVVLRWKARVMSRSDRRDHGKSV